ncbi:MAG: MgtC/SapB family protein [Pseudomonadota bacterium]|nr:MgtC/SapB family protein [Pseudomonadota bacterium]
MDTEYSLLLAHFTHIGIAIALGLLVGSERGWHERGLAEGSRVAGIRTFTLVALLGAVVAAGASGLPLFQRWLVSALVFLPVALLLVVGFLQSSRHDGNVSITGEIAAMLTYWLGVLPAFDLALPAAASAVIVALLLHLKETLHRLLTTLDHSELLGTLQFLLASLVLLPLLPNQGFGPWGALNPYQLWWMVVLISGLSLVGYFAMRLAGPRTGVLATSLTGGLVSSTAVTLSLSRLHGDLKDTPTVAAGILLACATMFARIMVVIAALRLDLLPALAIPAGAGLAILLLAAWRQWRRGSGPVAGAGPQVRNPFQLVPALQFAALLGVVMFAAEALGHWLGQAGLYALSLFTGLADVDAIVLSLAPKAGTELGPGVVVLCVAIAAATNTVMKGVYCRIIAGPALGWRVLVPAVASALTVVLAALAPVMA